MIDISKTLSVCIISKNEEKNIEKCIKSVKNIAEEVVVVDTGSTDNTIKIAKDLGAKVIKSSWKNDFSEARNKSIDNATGDWILFIDCDEELPEVEGKKLKALINKDEVNEAYYLRLVNIIKGVRISDAIVLRVFKNKQEYRFQGKMHEQIITSIQNAKGMKLVGETTIQIYHYGYDPNFSDTSKKSKRNLEILLSYDEKDKDGYYYYVLGNEYARMHDYEEALKYYEYSLKKSKVKMFKYIYYPYLVANVIKTLQSQKRYYDALKVIDDVRDTLPSYKDMYFLECLCYIEISKLSKASKCLEEYINCPVGSYEYPSNNYENFYDINKLIADLNKGLVPHDGDMLTVWIPIEKWDENIIECIKSINEIAFEVIIITTKVNILELEKVRQVDGKILNIPMESINKSFEMAMKITKGKNVLVINPNEICSHVSQIQIRNLLSEEGIGEGFGLRILNMDTGKYSLRFSLFKTNKNMGNVQEYQDYLSKKGLEIHDTEIVIHSKLSNGGD